MKTLHDPSQLLHILRLHEDLIISFFPTDSGFLKIVWKIDMFLSFSDVTVFLEIVIVKMVTQEQLVIRK